MKLGKTTAVIDKSLFQIICSEPDASREKLLNQLFSRYQLVIPLVLVEEVWINFGKPKQGKHAVILQMVETLGQMTKCWMDGEIEIVFRELIQGRAIKKLPPPPKELIDFSLRLKADDPKFLRWLEENRLAKEQAINNRIADQRDILPTGSFAEVSDEGDLFQRYARGMFIELLASSERTKTLLEKLFGHQFRHRHPNFKRRIEKAFRRFNTATFTRYPVTLSYIMASMFYFYAPLCRIQSPTGTTKRKIIGSKRYEQRNNLLDQRYVVSACLCDRLLTCDEGMNNIMQVFKQGGLWKGETIFLDPNQSIDSQLSKLLA